MKKLSFRVEYYVVEKGLGRSFTTYKGLNGVAERVDVMSQKVGPFWSLAEAADYLSEHAQPHTTYKIQVQRTLIREAAE